MNRNVILCEGSNHIHLAPDWVQWGTPVGTITTFEMHKRKTSLWPN